MTATMITKKNVIRILSLELALCLMISLSGCSNQNESPTLKTRSVKTVTTVREEYTEYMDYKGFVIAQTQKNVAFVQSGIVKEIYIEEGQHVNAGEVLAVLDTESINAAIENAQQDILVAQNGVAQLQIAYESGHLNLKKTQESYASAFDSLDLSYKKTQDAYDKTAILYDIGAVSKQDFDDVAYALENIKNEIKKTKQAYASDIDLQNKGLASTLKSIEGMELQKKQAEIGLRQYNTQLDYAILTSPIDGVVISVIAQVDQITGAGTPAVILKSEKQIISVGVSIDDVQKIEMGMEVNIELAGVVMPGEVSKIGQYPDESSRTYTVEIAPAVKGLTLGAIADIKILLKTKDVVLVPISAVVTREGVNFAYIIEKNENGENKIVRKEIILGEVSGSWVEAKNIEPSTIVVADDVKNIKENDIVIITDDEV